MNQLNKNVMPQSSTLQQTASTTDALIINSNSTIVSDELILQLQEQFGDSKQIYILNTSNNSVSSSSSYNSISNASNGVNNNQNTIQYLIVDKDVDINAILQDPSIFQNHQTNICNQSIQQQHQTSHQQQHNPLNHHLNKNQNQQQMQQQQQQQTTTNAQQSQQLLVEESIQRVQAPPPKRKQFEFKLDTNKRMSYQDAFLRFLAGEKQPTLEINTNDHANKKPKDNIYYNFYLNNPKLNPQSTTNQANNINLQANNVTNSSNTILNNSNSTNNTSNTNTTLANQVNTNGLDKENYYNSSRRENLLPLNNYEYRNSYKDHYDNQGVRLNPAIFKNLPAYSSTAQLSNNQTQQSTTSISSIQIGQNKVKINDLSNSSVNQIVNPKSQTIIVTKSTNKLNDQPETGDLNEILVSSNQIDQTNKIQQVSNLGTNLNDHTYKSNPAICIQNNNLNLNGNSTTSKIIIKETQPDLDLNLKRKSNSLNDHIIENDLKLKHTKLDQDIIVQNIEQTNNPTSDQISINNHQVPSVNSAIEQVVIVDNVNKSSLIDDLSESITFMQGEFLIHKPTFSGDFDNYEIWCVLDDQYLQKYEPVLLSTGERCHQSADVLAEYTANKQEFLSVKVEEKGKTENNNIVVGVLPEFEPKNNPKMASALLSTSAANATTNQVTNPVDVSTPQDQIGLNQNQTNNDTSQNVVVVTYDDLKSAFDVFLQVMASQYLNGEFLVKIKEIQDEYFKPSIEFIDTILNEKYNLLFTCLNNFLLNLNEKIKNVTNNTLQSNNINNSKVFVELKDEFKYLLEHKPKMLVQKIDDSNSNNITNTNDLTNKMIKKCESLNYSHDLNNLIILNENFFNNLLQAKYLVQFSGNLYDSDTLVNNTTIELNDKQYFVCSKICNLINLLHSLKHFKISYLEICSQKIESIKIQLNNTNGISSNPRNENNTNTDLLNYCLADSQWLLEMFEKFKQLLFDVDNLLSNESTNDPFAEVVPILNDDKTAHMIHESNLIETKVN